MRKDHLGRSRVGVFFFPPLRVEPALPNSTRKEPTGEVPFHHSLSYFLPYAGLPIDRKSEGMGNFFIVIPKKSVLFAPQHPMLSLSG